MMLAKLETPTAVRTHARRTGLGRALVASLVGSLATLAIAGGVSTASGTSLVVKTMKVAPYGTVLVNSKGFALYTYASDTKNHSNCTGTCLSAWPALTIPVGAVPQGKGVTKLGEFRRSDGRHQVTYMGRPLYLFASDTKAGQATGQGVGGFALVTVHAALATSSTSTTKPSTGYGY